MDCRRSFTGGPAIARSWAGVARSWAAVARALASVALSQAAVALFSPLVQGWLCGGGVLQWHPPVCLILFYFIFFLIKLAWSFPHKSPANKNVKRMEFRVIRYVWIKAFYNNNNI